jgi:hypothetical protein
VHTDHVERIVEAELELDRHGERSTPTPAISADEAIRRHRPDTYPQPQA